MENNISFEIPVRTQVNMIKVIGVGGGGGSAVNYMYNQQIEGVDFVVCNTDIQDLDNSPVPCKVHLGNDPLGTGAGANPLKGAQAANESLEDIENLFDENTRMVFITAGMGGGTGTGAAPVIAKIAKEKGILVIGFVTYPFRHEGKQKVERAKEGIDELRKFVDSLIVINNNKLRDVYGNLGRTEGYAKADEVLKTGVKGVAEVISKHYKQNIDLQDAKTVLENSGTAIMGTATEQGADRAKNAIIKALDSPLLNDNKIEGARNVLLLIISGDNEITIDEIGEISDYIQAEAGHEVEIIMGYGRDDSEDNISVTIVATGFKIDQQHTITNTEAKKIFHTLEDDQSATYDFEEKTIIGVHDFNSPIVKSTSPRIVHSLDIDKPDVITVPEPKPNALVTTNKAIRDIEVEYDEISLVSGGFVIKEMPKEQPRPIATEQSSFDRPLSTKKNTAEDTGVVKRYVLGEEDLEEIKPTIKNTSEIEKPQIDEALDFKVKTRNTVKKPTIIETNITDVSPFSSSIEEVKNRSVERINTMKLYNHRFSKEINSEELESIPAYKRAGIKDTGMGTKLSNKDIALNNKEGIDLSQSKYLYDNID